MKKIMLFFKKRHLQLFPLGLTSLLFIVSLLGDIFSIGDKYCLFGCSKLLWGPIEIFTLFFIPGSLSLVFVKKRVLFMWLLFFFPYSIATSFLVSSQSTGGWPWSDRVDYAGKFGLTLSVITILWASIYSFLIRLNEKRVERK